ncbi:MAG: hypothetical protein QM820_50100 [Minicystis sp.]
MRFRFSWIATATVLALAFMPMKTGGCGGKTVCIKASNGICPSADGALQFFQGGLQGGFDCSSTIESVNGEASFDGQFCCYPITETSFGDIGTCIGVGGFAGFAGSGGCLGCGGCFDGCCFGECGGFGGVAGSGGTGGTVSCTSCADQLSIGGDPDQLCGSSFMSWSSLQSCGCGICGTECSASLCVSAGLDSTCADCLNLNCSAEFSGCAMD